MRNFICLKCSKKLAEKCAKVHPTPPPLNPPGFVKEASQIQDQPQNLLLPEKIIEDYASKSRCLRVVVTRKQLKQMLKNTEALKSMGVSIQFVDRLGEKGGRSLRWIPSLATITE